MKTYPGVDLMAITFEAELQLYENIDKLQTWDENHINETNEGRNNLEYNQKYHNGHLRSGNGISTKYQEERMDDNEHS